MENSRKEESSEEATHRPQGLDTRTHGLAAEYSQQQGWGTKTPSEADAAAENAAGGTDYDYGAADFGERPSNRAEVQPAPEAEEFLTGHTKEGK